MPGGAAFTTFTVTKGLSYPMMVPTTSLSLIGSCSTPDIEQYSYYLRYENGDLVCFCAQSHGTQTHTFGTTENRLDSQRPTNETGSLMQDRLSLENKEILLSISVLSYVI